MLISSMSVRVTCELIILQLIEAVVLPMTHKDRFQALGIQPPKGLAKNTLALH